MDFAACWKEFSLILERLSCKIVPPCICTMILLYFTKHNENIQITQIFTNSPFPRQTSQGEKDSQSKKLPFRNSLCTPIIAFPTPENSEMNCEKQTFATRNSGIEANTKSKFQFGGLAESTRLLPSKTQN